MAAGGFSCDLNDEDVERTRTVDALHAVQLDVGLVADGPETSVIGRPSAAASASWPTASGTPGHDARRLDQHAW